MIKLMLLLFPFLLTATEYRGLYKIPAKGNLKNSRSYTVNDFEISTVGNVEYLSFTLPVGLVGKQSSRQYLKRTNRVSRRYHYYENDLMGAKCYGLKLKKLVCRFKGYDNLKINFESVENHWQGMVSESELDRRIKLSRYFAKDPIGKFVLWPINRSR